MGKRGPKTYSEKLFDVVEGYKKITPHFFKFLTEKMETGTQEEKWKVCQIVEGGMKKFIPNVIQGDKDNPLLGIIQYPLYDRNTLEATPKTGETST